MLYFWNILFLHFSVVLGHSVRMRCPVAVPHTTGLFMNNRDYSTEEVLENLFLRQLGLYAFYAYSYYIFSHPVCLLKTYRFFQRMKICFPNRNSWMIILHQNIHSLVLSWMRTKMEPSPSHIQRSKSCAQSEVAYYLHHKYVCFS